MFLWTSMDIGFHINKTNISKENNAIFNHCFVHLEAVTLLVIQSKNRHLTERSDEAVFLTLTFNDLEAAVCHIINDGHPVISTQFTT